MIDFNKLRELYKFSKDVTLKDAHVVIKSAKLESIPKKTILFEQGSKKTKLYYLRKGLVRTYHIKDNGDEITYSFFTEHSLVANFEFIGMQMPSNFYYETFEDCSFLSIDYSVLEDIIKANPKLEINRKFLLRKIVHNATDRIKTFVLMNTEERYLKFIKDFPDISNRVPDRYIAQVLGITPVSLSRIRKRLAKKKL